jgi:hypothetical protein
MSGYFARGARVRGDTAEDDGLLDVSGLLDAGLLYAALKTHPNDADMLGKCCVDGVAYKIAIDTQPEMGARCTG